MLIEILVILIVAIVVFLLCIAWGIGTYNTFITAKQDIFNQFSNIKTEYQRRADLILNLAESVKSYKKFEKSTMVEVIKARSGTFGSSQVTEMKKLGQLDKLFNKIALTFEAYPNLKANESYNTLMEELKTTENRINIARTDYNGIVNDYNRLVKSIPTNVIAKIYLFKEEKYFDVIGQNIDKAPKLNLES